MNANMWQDRPPTYDRLLVDTLVDIRRNVHKHALLTSQSHQPPSPYTPISDRSSIHSDGTFEIDLKSIWSQKTTVSTIDRAPSPASASSRASSPAPRSLGDESFFPTPVSPVSFLHTDGDADDELDDDPLMLDYEPAPAYDAAPYDPRPRTISAGTPSTQTYRARSASGSTLAAAPDAALSADDDDLEDPWIAFAAACWASCVEDDPYNPPAYTFGRHTFLPGPSSIAPRRAPIPAPTSELEPESEPEDDLVVGEPELVLAPIRYNPAFARTDPELRASVDVWGAGDNAIAHALGLEDDFLDYELDYAQTRPPRVRSPGIRKLEYVPPRTPSPPREMHKIAPTHERSGSAGAFKRLWRWRTTGPGKENAYGESFVA